jgi:mono/diheme cytochrome c family protein
MSAMPAWGKSLDDGAIWELVAFVRKLPNMSADAYEQLASASTK